VARTKQVFSVRTCVVNLSVNESCHKCKLVSVRSYTHDCGYESIEKQKRETSKTKNRDKKTI